MIIFIVSGVVGSCIFTYLSWYVITMAVGAGSSVLYEFLGALPAGLLGGFAGYGLHNLNKSSHIIDKVGFIILAAILGFILSILMLILRAYIY